MPLAEHLTELIASGASPSELEQAETQWIEDHQLMTFEEGQPSLPYLLYAPHLLITDTSTVLQPY